MSESKTNGEKLPNGDEFDWIKLREEIGGEVLQAEETFKQKFSRKFNENPFVPVGCGLTACALIYGLWSFRQGYVSF